MVRESVLIQFRKPNPYAKAVLLSMFCLLLSFGLAANARGEEEGEAAENPAPKKSLTLKLMVVNPSQKFQQTYALKTYLPEEIQPQHVMDKEDLEIAYDSTKQSYYVTKEIVLDPGQSVVKSVKVEDVWRISEDQLQDTATEARQIFEKLVMTPFEEKARLLLNNIEVILTQIFELQNDESMTPEEHIAAYRGDKEKLREIELDLAAMRRLLVQSGEAAGGAPISSGGSSIGGFVGANADAISRNTKGSIPAWVAWRVIFIILGFLGISAGVMYVIWHRQFFKMEKEKRDGGKLKTDRPVAADPNIKLFEDVLDKTREENKKKTIVQPIPQAPPSESKDKMQAS